MSTTKTRDVPFIGPNADLAVDVWWYGTDNLIRTDHTHYDMREYWSHLQGKQVTVSESHPNWRSKYLWENYTVRVEQVDAGGEFTSEKTWVASPYQLGQQTVSSQRYNPPFSPVDRRDTHKCAVIPISWTGMPFPPSGRSSEGDLMRLGTTAIARCAPTNSVANLSTTLLELYREGIPNLLGSTLWKERVSGARAAKAAGSEYLTKQFGWDPLISDVTDLAKGLMDIDKLVKQYERDAGKVVRRRYNFPPILEESEHTVASDVSPVLVTQVSIAGDDLYDPLTKNKGSVIRSRQKTVNQWFSGSFTYHLPSDWEAMSSGHLATARKLLGLELTPEVLWELAPWSWAVDWFSNLGDYIHNATDWSIDGLVLRYGYIMEHSIVRDTYTFVGPTGFRSSAMPQQWVLVTETKLRRKATPFGFGFDLSSLTSQQAAILAALGLARS